MDRLARFLERPPDDLLGGSIGQQTRSETPRRAELILLGLLLWCLVPRTLMLFRIGAVCDDGYYYITMADSLRRGDFETAFYYLNINVYPAVLLALHGAGLEWVLAGKLWGLLISSLVVLPTFGWVRRLFDDRIAIAVCFLYGIHPELIEYSIEPIREPTFWFLLNMSLYLTCRAVAERKWRLFALAGIAVSLAIHARVEGWFLVGAVLLWPLFHWKSAHGADRFRLASGIFLCLGVTPVLLVAVNITLLRHHDRWEWGRLSQFQTCWEWIRTHQNTNGPRPATTAVPVDATAVTPPSTKILRPLMQSSRTVAVADPSSENGTMQNRSAAEVVGHPSKPLSTLAVSPLSPAADSSPSSATPMSFSSWHVRKYLEELIDTMEPVNSLLLLIGLIAGRRTLLQREKLILAFLSLAVLWGVWIRLWSSGDMNGRYLFTPYLLLLPFEAIGLLVVLRYLTELVARRTVIRLRPGRPAATLLFLLTVVFWADAFSSRHASREADAMLGRLLQNAYGPFGTVLVDNRGARIGYYAQGDIPAVRFNYQPLEPMIDQHHPDLLILSKKESTPIQRYRLLEKTTQLGYRPVRLAAQTAAADEFILLVRRPGEQPMGPNRNDRQAARLPVTRQ